MDLERDIGGRELCGLSRQASIARWSFGDELCDPAAGERLVLNGLDETRVCGVVRPGWAGLPGWMSREGE
jgi:hypothetical protein